MSEIWTPKGPAPQQPSGGIELPKGFARRRTEEEKKPEAETPAPPAASEPAPPNTDQPARPRSQRPEFLFPPQGVQVQCPSCGTPFTAPVFSIVDLGANPELREPLLGGQINAAICQNCGAGGALSAPLMVHDPANEFLGVLVPRQAQLQDMQVQQVIGEMSKALMGRLSSEQRRGYMLNPKQFFDWDSFLETLWGFEGVTPEMLRTQREQSELITSLVRLAPDVKAMKMVADRRKKLIDRDFFALLGQVVNALGQQGQQEVLDAITQLRTYLLDTTEAGSAVKATEEILRQAVARLSPTMSRDDFLDLLLEYWDGSEDGESIAVSLLTVARGLADYQFLMTLTERIDATDDPEVRGPLISLRELVVEISQQSQQSQAQSQEAMLQQVQAFLQEVLQSPNPDELLREKSDQLNEMFLAVLASNIQQAEEKKATFAVKRLRAIYDSAMEILQGNLPPDLRLLNQLVSLKDESEVRRLLQENRSLLSKEFVEGLRGLEERFRSENNTELAARIKSVRVQATMLL
ncbi:MAG: CpXC domain-containing protein [Caldilineaceae bacterium]